MIQAQAEIDSSTSDTHLKLCDAVQSWLTLLVSYCLASCIAASRQLITKGSTASSRTSLASILLRGLPPSSCDSIGREYSLGRLSLSESFSLWSYLREDWWSVSRAPDASEESPNSQDQIEAQESAWQPKHQNSQRNELRIL